MRSSRSNEKIFTISGKDLFKYTDIKNHLENMMRIKCGDTIINQPCYDTNCEFLLYIRGFEGYDIIDTDDINIMDLKTIRGFLTVTTITNTKNNDSIGEIFNLCHNSNEVAKELLNSVIKTFKNLSQFWIAVPLQSSKWNPLINTIVEIGFDSPALTHYAPSGKRLNYDYMGFIFNSIYFYSKPSQDVINDTVNKANSLKQKILQPQTSKPKTPKPKTPKPKTPVRISPPVSFPVEEKKRIYRKDGTSFKIKTICLHGYQLQKYIAEGTYGVVYKTCTIDGNCNYVIKIQKFEGEESVAEWHKEVMLMQLLNKYNIGAKIAGSWLCGQEGFIVSELWDGDLKNRECPPKDIVQKLRKEITTIHDLGYVHGDILPKNILVKRNSKGGIIEATLSDFGTVNTPQNWQDRQKLEGWLYTFYVYHIQPEFSFNRSYYKDNNITFNDIVKDPRHLDEDLIYYLENNC